MTGNGLVGNNASAKSVDRSVELVDHGSINQPGRCWWANLGHAHLSLILQSTG